MFQRWSPLSFRVFREYVVHVPFSALDYLMIPSHIVVVAPSLRLSSLIGCFPRRWPIEKKKKWA